MNMVVELIKIINIYNTKVIFDDPKECQKRLLNSEFIIYFTPVEGKERSKYEKSHNKKMVSTTPAIHMPNLSVRELVNTYECDGTGVYDVTKEMIEPFLSEEISFDVVFTTFLFLHEVGHWMQFEEVNRNIFQYLSTDIDLEKDNFNKVSALIKQRAERIKKGINNCVLTTNEKNLFHQYMLEYRNIPKEKDADLFALSNIRTALELILNSKKL